MRILAINCGSSSIKAAIIDSSSGERVMDLRAERLGTPAAAMRVDGDAVELPPGSDRKIALQRLFAILVDHPEAAALQGIAHRIVHGGTAFTGPTLVSDATMEQLAGLDHLAPLHNPPALAALRAARAAYPSLPQVGVFDTSFHATLPRRAREYALPRDVVEKHGLQRFGFHGISHEHVCHAAAAFLESEPAALRIVSCHLGNGASCAAIEYGRSIDTSMGMTPLEGLVMGTRAGDLDPGILLSLQQQGSSAADLEQLLNQRSGLKGLAGTEDMAAIEARAQAGDEQCRLAIAVFAHRVRKYIGAYSAVMGGVDVIAFTGGIGEHSVLIRHRIAQRLDWLGARLDEDRNRDVTLNADHPVVEISTMHSRTRLLVIRADEEAGLAAAAAALLAAPAIRTRPRIPVAVSARHVHLSQASVERLFGKGHRLTVRKPLSQPGQFAAEETVTLVGPRGRIEAVRVLGPPRAQDQVEISRTDEFTLGIDAPVRISGDTANSPGIVVESAGARVVLPNGVICARRHIHMHSADALAFGLRDHDTVSVRIDSDGRDLIFGDVTVRVSADFRLEMHLDVDEANAAGLACGDTGELLVSTEATAQIQ